MEGETRAKIKKKNRKGTEANSKTLAKQIQFNTGTPRCPATVHNYSEG